MTAGIETTRVSPLWLEKVKEMDRVIVVSEHAKTGFKDTVYEARHESEEYNVQLFCARPVDVVHYPVKNFDYFDDPKTTNWSKFWQKLAEKQHLLKIFIRQIFFCFLPDTT